MHRVGREGPGAEKEHWPSDERDTTIRGTRRSQERHRRDERTKGLGQEAPDAQDDERQALERVVT